MSLSLLPPEIIYLITKRLVGQNKTLASLVACSKLLCALVTPVLYSDIKLGAYRVGYRWLDKTQAEQDRQVG